MTNEKGRGALVAWAMMITLLMITVVYVHAVPTSPSVSYVKNETLGAIVGSMRNESTGGGYVYTMNLSGNTVNTRWKAYVGNVSGKLVLADDGAAIVYDWTMTAIPTGEIYATRSNTTVDWGNIECANSTHIDSEIGILNQDSSDNLTVTFAYNTHTNFSVGATPIVVNECNYTTTTYINSVYSANGFQEIVMYDGIDIVYVTLINNSINGFDNEARDFQIILPEDDSAGSLAYYFYIELTLI